MTIKRKTNITLLILIALILLLIFLAINPIFGQIKKESQNLVIQRNKILESETKIKNIQDFQANFKRYQSNFEKIDGLFADISEPVEFIEFLEREAARSRLPIEISPPIFKKAAGDFWPFFEFSLNLTGSFPNFLGFLERLEAGPFLAEAETLNVRKNPKIEENIAAALSIKVYAK